VHQPLPFPADGAHLNLTHSLLIKENTLSVAVREEDGLQNEAVADELHKVVAGVHTIKTQDISRQPFPKLNCNSVLVSVALRLHTLAT
jgi:hypothetical protein